MEHGVIVIHLLVLRLYLFSRLLPVAGSSEASLQRLQAFCNDSVSTCSFNFFCVGNAFLIQMSYAPKRRWNW